MFYNRVWYRDIDGTSFTLLTYSQAVGIGLRPRFEDYEQFTFLVDGLMARAFTEEHKYTWAIANPDSAPTVAAHADAGNPNGTYQCYVTFYATFPNGKVMETGPSPVGEVTVTNKKIAWSVIDTAFFGAGDEPVVYRKLYRTVSGTAYLVTTIEDNTTTTYTDNVTDATLQASVVLSTDDYSYPPSTATDIAIYLQRVFLILSNKVYWSEPYMPWSFKTTSSGAVSQDDEDLVSVMNWGDQLYMASVREWYRLQGSDPTTWSIKRTFTDVGVINRCCTHKSKYGIIGLWSDGIYLFDGSISKNITEKILGREFFTDIEDLSVAHAEFDGTKYYFYYASSGTDIDSCMVLDFTYYPDVRIYHQDFFVQGHYYDKNTNINYYGKDNYEYSDGGTEVIPTSLITGDKGFQGLLKRKCLDYLYYDLDTNSKDVTVDIYADGSVVQTLTLNTDERTRKRSVKLKPSEGYRFAIGIDCSDSEDLLIYSPWALEATPVGE